MEQTDKKCYASGMKTVIISGTNHRGSTYRIARNLAEKVGGETVEFFLPHDFGEFCLGCTNCILNSETKCPHHEKLLPITQAISEADLTILSSPTYVYHVTGAMKALLDHYGYIWMAHRPEPGMFKKQAVAITTAAGAGMGSTLKDMTDSLFFWGTARVYKLGFAVAAMNWDSINEKKKKKIDKKTNALAKKITRRNGKVKPGFKTKAFFFLMHLMEKNGWNQADSKYWHEKGWTEKNRPWK